jgi:mercuric reductase
VGATLDDLLRPLPGREPAQVRQPLLGVVHMGDHRHALSGEPPRRVDHRVIPRAVFTDPQIGVVGLTDEEAVDAGHRCWCNTVPMELVPRAGAIRDTRGLIKMIDLVHVYPTMAEALKIVAISRYKDPARLSCCAE